MFTVMFMATARRRRDGSLISGGTCGGRNASSRNMSASYSARSAVTVPARSMLPGFPVSVRSASTRALSSSQMRLPVLPPTG